MRDVFIIYIHIAIILCRKPITTITETITVQQFVHCTMHSHNIYLNLNKTIIYFYFNYVYSLITSKYTDCIYRPKQHY